MGKGTHFIGQPMFGQLISLIDKSKVLGFSREKGGERYVKHFDAWQHLLLMVIQKRIKRTWKLLGTGHHVQNHAHVLRQLLHLLRGAGKGLAGDTQDNGSITPGANPF